MEYLVLEVRCSTGEILMDYVSGLLLNLSYNNIAVSSFVF